MLSTEQFFEHWLVKTYNDFLRGELHETNCYFSLLPMFSSEKKGPIFSLIWNFTVEIPFHHILRLPGYNITGPFDSRRLKVSNSIFYFLILLITFLFLSSNFALRSHYALSKNVHVFDFPIRFALYDERWQGWPSGESTCLPPMWPEFDFHTRCHMWIEFVGSLLCYERFFPGYSGFPLSSKTNI